MAGLHAGLPRTVLVRGCRLLGWDGEYDLQPTDAAVWRRRAERLGGVIPDAVYPIPSTEVAFSATAAEGAGAWRIPAVHVRGPDAATPRYTQLDEFDDMARLIGADVLAYEYVGYSLSRLEGAAPPND
eukprot:gene20809-15308_t